MKKRILAVLLCAALMGVGVYGCGSSDDSSSAAASSSANEETEGTYDGTVVLAGSTWIGYAPIFVAIEKGFFEENGVDVEFTIIEQNSDRLAALTNGSVTGLTCSLDTHALDIGNGHDIVQVVSMDTSDGGDGIVCLDEYDSLEELVGCDVAIDTTGGASLFYFNTLIHELGLTMDDFNCVNMSSADAGSAFISGNVDAAVTWEPWLTSAEETDFGKILCDSSTEPGLIVDSIVFPREFVESYPDTVQGIVDAWFAAVDYYYANPDECNQIIADGFGMDLSDVESSVQTVHYYGYDDNVDYYENDVADVSQSAVDLWYEMELVEEQVDAAEYIDASFINNSTYTSE